MTDPFSAMLTIQKQILDAQRASMNAMHKSLGIGDSMVAMQDAGQKAAEATFAAWANWAKIWGVK